MDQGQQLFFFVIVIVLFGGMMWWSSRKTRQQQKQAEDFRSNLQPGEEVITIGGIIGKVVSVDTQYQEIVLDSEGSQIRVAFRAIHKSYLRPAFIPDSEVDAQGNPLPSANAEQSDQTNTADGSLDTADVDATTTPSQSTQNQSGQSGDDDADDAIAESAPESDSEDAKL
ncbi:preprotein translocase subunit YajC [uncultured Bifidobacterium sp.]|uniref:preprotein translocase subunit YajC n=1 Tax=uncultured Bifidobacterium sp. TaxID=165187 RepID=UPI002622D785|nr:preprotein translocase subunit YajC [uncultured Bifidobacterium sp.]